MNRIKWREWLKLATTHELRELGVRAKIPLTFMHQLTYTKDKFGREASAKLAARIEIAAKPIWKDSKGRLPPLTRADLCETCAECPYYRKARSQAGAVLDRHYDSLVEAAKQEKEDES